MSPALHHNSVAGMDASSPATEEKGLPRQAKTRKGKRILQEREAQEHEDIKRLLLLRGSRASASVQDILADLRDMKKPHAVYLRSIRRRRDGASPQQAFHPFEDVSSGEFLCEKNNCGFFCLGSTSKKRPARLVFARMFAHQLLDMYELQVSRYTPASAFRGKEKPHVGSTPIVLLQGAHFEADEAHKGLRNLFADLFRGNAQAGHTRGATASSAKQERLYLAGIDRVIAITAVEPSGGEAAATAAATAQAAAAAALEATVQNAIKGCPSLSAAASEEENKEAAAGEEDSADAVSAGAATGSEQKVTREKLQQKDGGKALICLRHYRVVMKRGALGSNEPRVELEEVGPQIDLQLDRYRLADADRWKKATVCRAAATAAQRKQREAEAAAAAAAKKPVARPGVAVAAPAASSQKNRKKRKTTTTALGDVVGRVYVDKPDWRSLNAQKSVLLMKHNRKRAKLAAQETASQQ